jgi:hypothetical protein
MKQTLQDETIARIREYLAGHCSRRDTAAWAVRTLRRSAFQPDEAALEDAITALAGLHDDDERLDTAREDLIDHLDRLVAGGTHPTSERATTPAVAEQREPYE